MRAKRVSIPWVCVRDPIESSHARARAQVDSSIRALPTYERDTHQDSTDRLARLCQVVILDGRRDLSRTVSRHGFRRLGVGQHFQVVLLLDLERRKVVDGELDEDDRRVKDARVDEDLRVLKVNLAGDLHRSGRSALSSLNGRCCAR